MHHIPTQYTQYTAEMILLKECLLKVQTSFRSNDVTAILLPSADSRRVVSYKQKYVHEVLVNRLVELAQEKSVR